MSLRIDGRRGRQSGVSARPVTGSAGQVGDLGLGAVGDALNRRRAEREREEEIQQRQDDQIYMAEASSRTRRDWARLSDEMAESYDGSEPGFAQAVRQRLETDISTRLQHEDPRRANEMRARLAGIADQYEMAALNVESNRRNAYRARTAVETLEQGANAIQADPALFHGFLEDIDTLAAGLPAELAPRVREQGRDMASRAYVNARVEADPRGFLEEADSGDLDTIVPPAVMQAGRNAARTELDRRAREARAERRVMVSETRAAVREMLDHARDARRAGVPDGLDMSALERAAHALGDEGADLGAQIAMARALNDFQVAFEAEPPEDMARWVQEERARLNAAGGASPLEVERLTLAEGVLSEANTTLRNDPMAWYARSLRRPLPPMEAGDGEALAASLAARRDLAAGVADYYGATPHYFTAEERRTLAARVERGDLDRLEASEAIVTALGPGEARRALAEIAPDEPWLAHVGALVSLNAGPAAQDLSLGLSLRRAPGFTSRLPSGSRRQAAIAGDLGVIRDTHPETAQAFMGAADAIYEARAARNGWTREDFAPQSGELEYRRALHEAAGAVYTSEGRFGGFTAHRREQVVVPSWLRADAFPALVSDIAAGRVAGPRPMMMGADGAPVPPETLARARLRWEGGDRYLVMDQRLDAFFLDAQGQPYLLDLSDYRQGLARRRPEQVR